MQATKKGTTGSGIFSAAGLALALLIAGCGAPGPRALLQGERLLREENIPAAMEKLKAAATLMPTNAQAWNHLGLAYHRAGQFTNALPAYRRALALDRDLMAVHYNLGCLYLEHNNPAAAIDALTSYTAHPRHAKAMDGWLRLGSAQLRARRFDDAERTYTHLLRKLETQTPEVLNGLGMVHAQRRRAADALAWFNAALAQQPDYAPALLNLAVVSQQQPNSRALALQKYHDYLALKPTPPNWEAVDAVARQIEAELAPPTPRPAPAVVVAPVIAKTNLVAPLASVAPRGASNLVAVPVARTNPPPPVQPARPVVVATPAPISPPPKPPPVETTKPPVPPPGRSTLVEVTRVSEDPIIKTPQELSPAAPPRVVPRTNPPDQPATATPVLGARTEPKPEKRNFFQRLNPFGGKSKPATNTSMLVAVAEPAPVRKIEVTPPITKTAPPAPPAPPPPPPVPRYSYLSPAQPAAGDRRIAERFFQQGVKAQREGRPAQAISEYQTATQADPAYFDAFYNQGLAAQAANRGRQSLAAFEHALAIQPDSVEARYNFALALRQSNYPQDAANELATILKDHPNETRAHLSLGNVYSQQLNQPKQARAHYLKVLENEPGHAQAPQIRYWLGVNP